MSTATLPIETTKIPGRFGAYGGRYVPETLMAALEELDLAYAAAQADPAFHLELDSLLKDYAGRPTPLFFAARLTEQLGGAKIYLKREDLLHTGAHKINNCSRPRIATRQVGWASGALSRRPVLGSMAWPRLPSARCLGWNASSTWAKKTCGGRS